MSDAPRSNESAVIDELLDRVGRLEALVAGHTSVAMVRALLLRSLAEQASAGPLRAALETLVGLERATADRIDLTNAPAGQDHILEAFRDTLLKQLTRHEDSPRE